MIAIVKMTLGRIHARMFIPLFWFIGVLLFRPAAQAQDRPEVIVEVSANQMYEGETLEYKVTLNHVADPKRPSLEGFDDFHVKFLGESNLNSQQITIINGQRTEISRFGQVYQFALTAKKAGLLTIPAPTAEVDGKVIRGRSVTVKVVPPPEQDLVHLEILADRTHVYPMQPFEVRLKIAVRGLESPREEDTRRNPLTVQRRLPALAIPWVSDEGLPSGLRPSEPWQEWLKGYRAERGGFSVNNVGSRSVFSFFDDAPLGFLPKPRTVNRTNAAGEQVAYWEFEFSRRFVGTEVGALSFGPVTLKGDFITEVDRRGRAQADEIYAVARPIHVDIRDVPTSGQPDSYIHAIGTFKIDAALAPTQAKVGDPLTLTLSLIGEGTLDSARPPNLAANPDVNSLFRVYEATEETENDARRFTYSLRPLQAGEIEFPSIPVSYFDVNLEKYVTLATSPFKISISEAERMGANDIAMAAGAARQDSAPESREDGILANDDDYSALRNELPRPGLWLAYVLVLGTVYVGVVIAARQLGRYWSDAATVRRRNAPRRARDRLRHAMAVVSKAGWRDGAESVRGAFCGLVADFANQSETGVTPRETAELLNNLGVDETLRHRSLEFLEACDGARYGGTSSAMPQDETVLKLMDEIISALKSKRS